MAERLNRDYSIIKREIKRNSGDVTADEKKQIEDVNSYFRKEIAEKHKDLIKK